MARILLIEDDEALRDVLVSMLERKGYDVEVAGNGDEGIKLYRENPADLMITDIIMPVKGGIHTIVDLQKEYPDIKIIAISGGGMGAAEEYLEVVKVLSVKYALKKPFSNEELLNAIEDLLG
jgi:CheY-like chemotaxis protein